MSFENSNPFFYLIILILQGACIWLVAGLKYYLLFSKFVCIPRLPSMYVISNANQRMKLSYGFLFLPVFQSECEELALKQVRICLLQ